MNSQHNTHAHSVTLYTRTNTQFKQLFTHTHTHTHSVHITCALTGEAWHMEEEREDREARSGPFGSRHTLHTHIHDNVSSSKKQLTWSPK